MVCGVNNIYYNFSVKALININKLFIISYILILNKIATGK